MLNILLPPRMFYSRSARALSGGALVLLFTFASGCSDTDVPVLDAQDAGVVADPLLEPGSEPALNEEELASLENSDSIVSEEDEQTEREGEEPESYRAGEDPGFAREMGWPVEGPSPLAGAILPAQRILCYYGNPNSKRMGILGEYPKDEMLSRLDREVAQWNEADPAHPVKPCLHMVSVVAQGEPGSTGKYRSIMMDDKVSEVYGWAKERDAIFFVDIQVGTDDLRNILPRFEWILKNPDVHLAVDPEFMMKGGERPGSKIGTMDAADINYATSELARIVKEYNLPPKVLVIHRFTRRMVTNSSRVQLRPEVQIVMDMDGWGAPWLKRDSYRDYIVREPVQYTGFKLFYHNDTKKGDPLMSPADVLRLEPKPLYIQYQ